MSPLDKTLQDLDQLVSQLRRDRDAAKGEQVRDALRKIAGWGLLSPGDAFLGGAIERSSDAGSGLVVQAAAIVPDGFGVCIWDPEEYLDHQQNPDGLEPHARHRFKPYDQCDEAEKAVVTAHFSDLFEDVIDVAYATLSRSAPEGAMLASEFFESRRLSQDPLERLS